MTTEETQAQLLAQWLSQPPGTDPPEGLDENIVSAVYLARPDRAPSPQTSLDDILTAVRTGPYAQRAKFAVVSTEATAPPTPAAAESSHDDAPAGQIVSLSAARERATADAAVREVQKDTARADRMRKTRRWWLGPMVGAAVAAAAVLLVVGPIAGQYLSPTSARLSEQLSAPEATASAPRKMAAESQAAPAPPATVAELEAKTPPTADASGRTEGGALPNEPSPDPSAGLPQQEILAARKTGGEVFGDDAQAGPAALGYVQENPMDKGVVGGQGGASTSRGQADGVEGTGEAANDAVNAQERARRDSVTDAPATIPEMEESAAKDDSWGWGGKKEKARAIDEADLDREAVSQTTTTTAAQSPAAAKAPATGKPAPATSVAPSASKPAPTTTAPAPLAAPAPVVAPASAPPPPQVPAGRSTGATSGASTSVDYRSTALPKDYSWSWYAARSDVASAYATAESARAAGNVDGAVLAYSALMADRDPRVVQDAAWRAASALRGSGRLSEALAMVERGLSKSAANTSQRSQLLVLRGDVYAAQGNSAAAQAAWAEASALNAGRYRPAAAPAK